jgi:tetratricopeptide (TPR) repeat protein
MINLLSYFIHMLILMSPHDTKVIQTGTATKFKDAQVRSIQYDREEKARLASFDQKLKQVSEHKRLALKLLGDGKLEEAAAEIEKAERLVPLQMSKEVLAEILLRQRKFGEAAEVLEKIKLAHNPQDGLYARRGFALLKSGEVEKSRAIWSTAIFKDYYPSEDYLSHLAVPKDASQLEGFWLLAIVHRESAQANDATTKLYAEMSYQVIPDDPLLNLIMGKYHFRKRLFSEAAFHFGKTAKFGTGQLKLRGEREHLAAKQNIGS